MKTAWKWKCSWLVATLLVTGCAKFDLRKNIPWGEGKDGRIEQPMRIEVAWVDTVLSKPGQKPMRGFGGRLYFFGPNNSQESVKVDGTLVVYAFNETNRDPTNVIPDKKIVYPAKQFSQLYSESKLGDSYSVWVPWEEAGGPPAHISLIARFIPAKGSVIASEQVKLLLPGVAPLVDVRNVNSSQYAPTSASIDSRTGSGGFGDVQQASYQQALGGKTPGEVEPRKKPREIDTLTIPLRGSQTNHFIHQSGMSGGARVTTLSPSGPGWPGLNGADPNVMPANSMIQPLPASQAPFAAQPMTRTQPSAGPPSQTQNPKSSTTPLRQSGHSVPWRLPAQATLAAPPRFGRDPLEPHPAIRRFGRSSLPSPGTSPQLPGSSPAAGQPSSPGQTDYAAAY